MQPLVRPVRCTERTIVFRTRVADVRLAEPPKLHEIDRGEPTTPIVRELLALDTLGAEAVDLPGFAQLAAGPTIPRPASFVMH